MRRPSLSFHFNLKYFHFVPLLILFNLYQTLSSLSYLSPPPIFNLPNSNPHRLIYSFVKISRSAAGMAKRSYKLQEFVAHASNVNCLSIGKKSSRLLATGGEDQKVNLWAIGKPTSLLSLSGHTSPVESVTFDSAEVLVVSGASFGVIKLWDLEEAKILRTLTGHRSSCNALQFHPFGEFFASGSSDASLKVWDVRKKGCIHTYKGHTRGVSTIRFSPDGRWVVSGGADNVVKIWDLTAGKLLHEFKYHEGQIQCIDFHPLEFLLATGSADRTVKFWDLETFEMIGSAGPEATGVRSMIFHPDGKTLFCGLEDSLKVFSWEPIVCHDSVDMGWSTLGDLNINEGKLLGCSYYHNCVGVWAADISLFGPYVAGGLPTRSNAHMRQKLDIKESHAQHNTEALVTPRDIESVEIRNIYEDTSGSNKITPDRMKPAFSKDVVPLDSSKTSSPLLRKNNPETEVHVRSSSEVNNGQLIMPSIVTRRNLYTENVVTSGREVLTTENNTAGMILKATRVKRAQSQFDTEKFPVTNESRNNPSAEKTIHFRREATTTQNNLPEVKATDMRRSSSRKYETEKLPPQFDREKLLVPNESRNKPSSENIIHSRREATATENNFVVVKAPDMSRSSSRKYEIEKLTAMSESGHFSHKQADSYVAPNPDTRTEVPSKVEPTETVEVSPKNIKSVAEKFERILSPETPLRSSRESAQPQSCSREISSSKKVNKDQFGRTRSLVERWERRETYSSDEEVANTRVTNRVREAPVIASTNIVQESHDSSQMLKEPPQPSGRDSASINEENILEDLMRDHEIFTSSFHSRLAKLQVVRYFWQRTDVKGGLNAVGKLPDHAVQADVVSVLKEKLDIVSLELFSCLLPILFGLLHSQIDRHANVSLEMLLKLVAIFGPVIRSTMSASKSIGVDLQAERRRDCCSECFIQLQKIKQIIPSVTRRGGQIGKYALELNLFLQEW